MTSSAIDGGVHPAAADETRFVSVHSDFDGVGLGAVVVQHTGRDLAEEFPLGLPVAGHVYEHAVIGQKGIEGYRVLGDHIPEHVFVETGNLLFVAHRVIGIVALSNRHEGGEHREHYGHIVFHDAKIGIPHRMGVTVFSVCLIIFSSTIQVDANQKFKLFDNPGRIADVYGCFVHGLAECKCNILDETYYSLYKELQDLLLIWRILSRIRHASDIVPSFPLAEPK